MGTVNTIPGCHVNDNGPHNFQRLNEDMAFCTQCGGSVKFIAETDSKV